jgi:hypothetical protein
MMVAEHVPADLIAALRSIWRRRNGDADDVVLSAAELTPLLHTDLLGPLRHELADPRRVLQDQARRPGSIAYRALTSVTDGAFTFDDFCLLVCAYLMYRENEGPMCPLCDSPLSRLPRWNAFECTCDGLCSRFAEDLRLGIDHLSSPWSTDLGASLVNEADVRRATHDLFTRAECDAVDEWVGRFMAVLQSANGATRSASKTRGMWLARDVQTVLINWLASSGP